MKLINRKNKLWITFYHQSKRHRKSLNLDDTKANRKLAETKLIPEIQYKLNNGEFFENDNVKKVPTVDEFFQVSFEIHKNHRRFLTQKNHLYVYKHNIKPYLGNKKLDEIKPSQIATWQNKLLETLSTKSLSMARAVLNVIFNDAIADEIILRNPLSVIKKPHNVPTREIKPFSQDEIFKLLDNVNEKVRCYFAIGFFTGMRTGEILALKWSDIDYENGIIKVRRSKRQGIESEPKTKASIRDVDILDILIPYLKNHLKFKIPQSDYLFTSNFQKPYNDCMGIFARYWKPLFEKLDIQYRNPYQMRHTFASMMISNGEDILWVSNMLGHTTSAMTLTKYAKYIVNKEKKRGTFLTTS
ncbi:integrase family protein [Arcobacter nitrofigilis DSM 7299]|uniref:Integrase family protein n=1 Tax=Arcobacter nitrofigilis (strain ATCC 33309 / DSM 7299 / CCUG 15893 / LMG 7604 / NCTC 12251 / CI) TaxID=572480 RepID=D5V374_ARCNC|nr:site-specific integrase [Arcobacter nitrofigilis]ADG92656.1 integrase family protein [Arcobacter nitrofigilis DSM 7299]